LDAYERLHGDYSAFPGIDRALQLLQERGVSMAIVTGKGRQSAAISLKYLGLASYFEMIEAGSASGAVKPQAMQKVLAHWGVSPQHVACIGDSPSDVRSAKHVGALSLGAAWASTASAARLSAEEPSVLFHTVENFITWIERNVD
ncbi:MAG TPA: HAD-IA family hydrolase, partial [Ktedonobacteraceae bacterium]|nr:HAD-IA family hydrolase [Ktedonobacteraceae bacterium]